MKTKFRIPISFKLISITVLLLAITTAIIAMQSASRFEEISADREEQASRDQTRALASEVDGLLLSYIDKAKVVGSLLMKEAAEDREKSLDFAFYRDRDLVAIEVLTKTPGAEVMRVVNERNLKADVPGLDKSYIDTLRTAQRARGMVKFEKLFAGVDGYFEVRNSFIKEGAPLVTIGFPLAKDDNGVVTHIVLAEISLSRLQKIFAPSAASHSKKGSGDAPESLVFLVDNDGGLLAHSEKQELLYTNPQVMKEAAIVKTALASTLKQGQQRFQWNGKPYISVYTKTAFGVSAVRMVDSETISKAARIVKREAFYVAGRILSVALFFMFVFSITLTSPIEALAELANRVAKGDFSSKASVRSHDEVGQLGEAFNHMIEGLVERDKVKNMFSKFHGSSVTEDLLKHGDVQLGGSKKVVTVFFSDVRDFTKFSEGHTPEEVVEMLNEYFQIMVKIINDHGGVVDKFIGDAIMAVWGAPNATERDTQNAVKACIEMRKSLQVLNDLRASRNQVPIKIGIGLHRGEAISGTIGSSERMEYTVIGDTVNQASRIESSTKAFGTDLLISDTMANLVQEEFIVEEAGKVEVKGKSEPLTLFKVRGFYDENKNPVLVRTTYSDYEAGDADKVKMAG